MLEGRTRTAFVVGTVIAGIVLSLVACAVPTSQIAQEQVAEPATTDTVGTEQTTEEPVELVVWSELFVVDNIENDPTGAGRYGRYLKEQFEKEHPGVTVTLEYHGWDEELFQNVVAALSSGTAPDVVVGENFHRHYVELGALMPLDDVLGDVHEDLIHGTYKAAEIDGTIYGVPAFTGVFGFERNCEVVEAAGLDCDDPPETWDELLEHARAITEEGDGQYYGYTLQGPVGYLVGSAFRIAVYLAQADARLCKDDCSYPYFDNPNAVPVLEFVRELNKYTPPGLTFNPDEAQVYMQLFQGLSAYQIAGSWHPTWAEQSGCEDCRYSSVPIPAGGHPASLVVGNVIYSVLSESEHPELAAEWVKFLVRDDVQDLIYPSIGRLPTTRSALTRLRPTVEPATQVFIDELLKNPELGVLPQWRKNPQKLWRIYNDMLAQVLTTDRPVKEIMDEAQARAEDVMGR